MHDVSDIGFYDARSLAGFPAFNSGIMCARRHICGQKDPLKQALKIPRSSVNAIGPSSLRNAGGTSSGPAALYCFIFLIARFSSAMVKVFQSAFFPAVDLSLFLNSLFVSLSSFVNL